MPRRVASTQLAFGSNNATGSYPGDLIYTVPDGHRVILKGIWLSVGKDMNPSGDLAVGLYHSSEPTTPMVSWEPFTFVANVYQIPIPPPQLYTGAGDVAAFFPVQPLWVVLNEGDYVKLWLEDTQPFGTNIRYVLSGADLLLE